MSQPNRLYSPMSILEFLCGSQRCLKSTTGRGYQREARQIQRSRNSCRSFTGAAKSSLLGWLVARTHWPAFFSKSSKIANFYCLGVTFHISIWHFQVSPARTDHLPIALCLYRVTAFDL